MSDPAGPIVSSVVLRRAAEQPTRKNVFWIFAQTLCEDANIDPEQAMTVTLLRELCQVPRGDRPALRNVVRNLVIKDGQDLLVIIKNFIAGK
jgi:hypothetical protein